ncbi:CRISPR-associated protein Cas6 [Parafrankia sp. EAN1pec]|nr:CRISPR-associated protein Cas6 [Frankia sp. EAN1pec]
MRFRVDVGADKATIPWRDVFGPARAVAYELIRGQDADLAEELHGRGYAGSSLRPLGLSSPYFRGPARGHDVYRASKDGTVWFGSPVPRIAGALLAGLAGRRQLRWGSVELDVHGVQLESTPDHSSGETVFSTVTPVLARYEDRYIFPDHPAFVATLVHNLSHKADVLGLPNEVEFEVLSAGPPRKFFVQHTPRHGCVVRARVHAAPALLDALYDWGLGLGTNQGFGWIR